MLLRRYLEEPVVSKPVYGESVTTKKDVDIVGKDATAWAGGLGSTFNDEEAVITFKALKESQTYDIYVIGQTAWPEAYEMDSTYTTVEQITIGTAKKTEDQKKDEDENNGDGGNASVVITNLLGLTLLIVALRRFF